MKKYKFIINSSPNEITKRVNKYVKQGWSLKDWKLNDNVITVLLEKEDLL